MTFAPGFADQVPVEFDVLGYRLSIPSGHPMRVFFDPKAKGFQPYREAGLILLATALERLQRRGTIVDIGANVGDTIAILHRHCSLDLLGVEASDFFFPYLQTNVARHFSDRTTLRHTMVMASVAEGPKGLHHLAGSARPGAAAFTETSEIVAIGALLTSLSSVALVKIDIDGDDIDLVTALLAEHSLARFPIYFEFELATDDQDRMRALCQRALHAFAIMLSQGYRLSVLWDDAGRLFGVADLRNPALLVNAMNYMGHTHHRPVWGFDIAILHDSDTALIEQVKALASETAPLRVM